MDPFANALNAIKTHEHVGKRECIAKPASKMTGEVLKLLQANGYVGDFEFVDDGKSGAYRMQLLGRVNDCGVIKPHFAVKAADWLKWEARYLPGKVFGLLLVSTPQGIMTHAEAKKRNIGGRLLAYVY